ncbi:MAG: histone deacetylase [Actinobacteria bacterium]|nr:histone deacetylase [Actinomycetota bacterium]
MAVLFASHPVYLEHIAGVGHPERPDRLTAVAQGVRDAGFVEAVVPFEPRPATVEELTLVHPVAYVEALDRFCAAGGGQLDPDTGVVPRSFDAALRAVGAGLDAVERLDRGEGDAAFCAVRPPGHHATPTRGMGFCLFNSIAVTAAALAARGERVLVLDYDAHHGNGTQDAFYADPRVLVVSFHQYPLYPGTGALRDIGDGEGVGTTLNLPLPAGATGDVYRAGFDRVVRPVVERFAPTWVLLSAGFDAHRADPLTDLALTAGDFADLTAEVLALVPAGRRVVFLEGGYDLVAVARSTAACLGAMTGTVVRPESPSTGGPGADVVDAAVRLHLGDGI